MAVDIPITIYDTPMPRSCHTAVLNGKLLIVFGGWHAGILMDELFFLDLSATFLTWTKQYVPDGPSARAGHCAAVVGYSMYVFGGRIESGVTNELWELDIAQLVWKKLSPMGISPVARERAACIVYKNRLYVHGGWSGDYYCHDVHMYDPTSNAWIQQTTIGSSPPAARWCHAGALVNGRYFMIMGGKNNDEMFNDIWLLDLETMMWVSPPVSGSIPMARFGHTLTYDADTQRAYVFGGDDGNGRTNSMLALDISLSIIESQEAVVVSPQAKLELQLLQDQMIATKRDLASLRDEMIVCKHSWMTDQGRLIAAEAEVQRMGVLAAEHEQIVEAERELRRDVEKQLSSTKKSNLREVGHLRDEFNTLTKKYEALVIHEENMRMRGEATARELATALSTINEQAAQAVQQGTEIKHLKQVTEQQQGDLSARDSQNQELQAKLDMMTERMADLQHQLDASQAKHSEAQILLQKQVEEANSQMRSLTELVETLREESEAAKEQSSAQMSELQILKEKLEAEQQSRAQLEETVTSMRQRVLKAKARNEEPVSPAPTPIEDALVNKSMNHQTAMFTNQQDQVYFRLPAAGDDSDNETPSPPGVSLPTAHATVTVTPDTSMSLDNSVDLSRRTSGAGLTLLNQYPHLAPQDSPLTPSSRRYSATTAESEGNTSADPQYLSVVQADDTSLVFSPVSTIKNFEDAMDMEQARVQISSLMAHVEEQKKKMEELQSQLIEIDAERKQYRKELMQRGETKRASKSLFKK